MDPLTQRLEKAALYGFVDTAYLNGRAATDVARQLCDGGVDVIQVRAKQSSLEEVRRLAFEIAPIIQASKVLLVINDYPELAREVGADLCHLGQEDFFDCGHIQAREIAGSAGTPGLGLSTHSPDQAARSAVVQPSYIAIGPVFPTGTKPTAPAVTLDYVRWASRHVTIPWFAIGGITLDNLDSVVEAGASRICVVSAILNQRNISDACQAFRNRLASALRQRRGPIND